MKFKNRTLDVSVDIKADEQDGLKAGEFIVYPSTFTRIPDAYGDVVAVGAFEDTIQEWMKSGFVMPGLYGHRMDDPDYFVAGATEMIEDEKGWRVRGEFDFESPKTASTHRLVKGKRLNQLSFAYDTLDQKTIELEDGTEANELRALKVYEFSFVPIGANQDTSVVAVKSATDALRSYIDMHSKEGRVLATRHVTSLRSAWETIGAVLTAAEGPESDPDKGANENEAEASGDAPANGEDPDKGNPEEQEKARSARAEALVNITQALV